MGANTGVADIDTGLILRMLTENTPHFGRDNVPGILDMVGQVINSRQIGFLYMVGQGSSRENPFVSGPETKVIS